MRLITAAGRKRPRRARETNAPVPTGSTSIYDLADELLELVFLHLSSPVCLVRAAAACRPWRRVIAAHGFLRRFRSLHGPHVLGHFNAGAKTQFVSASSPPGEVSLHVRSRLSHDFLANFYGLYLTDCRYGLLAFVHNKTSIVVCDPWTRQYRLLMPPLELKLDFPCYGAFLLDADETGTTSHMSNFRVLCVSFFVNKHGGMGRTSVSVSVFSATDNRWLSLATTNVDAGVVAAAILFLSILHTSKFFAGRVGGSLFWSFNGTTVIQVNESTGAFSSFFMSLGPAGVDDRGMDRGKVRAVVHKDSRTVRVVCIVEKELVVLQLMQGRGVCKQEKRVDLFQLCNVEEGPGRPWHFLELISDETVAPGCIMLSPNQKCSWMFLVDVETMEVERIEKRYWHKRQMLPYELPWPPTIKACL
ncbi:hypothetical protein PR202_gn00818 [Eleusine coracana subsp. coracana]|uniref:F-box domain-containing protein n=1 Tax=Eleusine coracana subsp. coracana TaxID=191504 RepID=A0AAV5G536_ELECO|nr:hypothetical protein PR202_gn00818 [Eleusine coracana subsp. coracana]